MEKKRLFDINPSGYFLIIRMSIKHQDQEEPIFSDFYETDGYDYFDYFDFHNEDDYLGFSEHNLTFQPYQDDQKVENDCPVSSQVSKSFFFKYG